MARKADRTTAKLTDLVRTGRCRWWYGQKIPRAHKNDQDDQKGHTARVRLKISIATDCERARAAVTSRPDKKNTQTDSLAVYGNGAEKLQNLNMRYGKKLPRQTRQADAALAPLLASCPFHTDKKHAGLREEEEEIAHEKQRKHLVTTTEIESQAKMLPKKEG